MDGEEDYRRRWWILAVLCLSVVIVQLGNLILIVALPTIQQDLGASSSELQWMVDAYTLVFAALLFTSGSLGDRFGRKLALTTGLGFFGLASLVTVFSVKPEMLIAFRSVMGVGAALILPATLSIINNVFPLQERGKAIGIWAGMLGISIPLGPVISGILLEIFWWGSVFIINVPITVVALGLGRVLVPESRDSDAPRPDIPGALLSIAGLAVVVYGVISASDEGWTDPSVLLAIRGGLLILALFVGWELWTEHPMVPMRFFRIPAFSGAAATMLLLAFSMFGVAFMLALYLQNVLGYGPLAAGLRLVPMFTVAIGAPLGASLTGRIGRKVTVPMGLFIAALGLFALSTLTISSEARILWALAILGLGLGTAMSPTVDALLGSIPREKSGVSSAAQQTSIQLGGTLGVAMLGSVLYSTYADSVEGSVSGLPIPEAARGAITDSLAAAIQVAQQVGGPAGGQLAEAAREAFVEGMGVATLTAVGLMLAAAMVAAITLPNKDPKPELPPRPTPTSHWRRRELVRRRDEHKE